eukprot:m.4488 g.4488  ORF g.4488 m.4488 type:complete len:203 (+) comp6978_c0_seq3:1987-2595(+)
MLHVSAASGVVNQVDALLILGADDTLRNRQGKLPLSCAVEAGSASACKLLLRSLDVAELLKLDHQGWNPFHWACSIGDVAVANTFQAYFPELFDSKTSKGECVLHLLAVEGNVELLANLMRCNRHCLALYLVNRDHSHATPLEVAVASDSQGAVEILKLFIESAKLTPQETEDELRSAKPCCSHAQITIEEDQASVRVACGR